MHWLGALGGPPRSAVVVGTERGLAGEDVEQDRSQAEDVRARIDGCEVPARLLGRHVLERPDPVAVDGDLLPALRRRRGALAIGRGRGRFRAFASLGAHDLRETPVHHVDLAEVPHHDVGRFQVAMHDTERVRERHGFADALDDGERGREINVSWRGGAADPPGERAAFDELHREERPTVERAEVVHGYHAGVFEESSDTRLVQEARDQEPPREDLLLRGQVRADRLERHVPAQVAVESAVHDAHPALPDLRLDLVAILGRAREQRERRGSSVGIGHEARAREPRQARAEQRSVRRMLGEERLDVERRILLHRIGEHPHPPDDLVHLGSGRQPTLAHGLSSSSRDPEPRARTAEPLPGDLVRDAERFGDLVVGEAALVPESEDLAILLRQTTHPALDPLLFLPFAQARARSRAFDRGPRDGRLERS